ncbi:response regulator [Candidatus Methylomirabilis sp.]|uniref:response regulator n=1 Tax=Candidatus Methylomirabilis sp. TaxID=2032687 RepID=UPI002A5F8BA8|nr:response regulator [Candidatus Methylomirabilis sp.]
MSNQRKVLIVTPELSVRQQILSRVSAKGYEAVAAERGYDALLTVVEQNVGLVIIDLSIDESAGVKTVEILRKIRPRLPLVVVSGDRSLEAGRQVLQHGVFYYLLKPVDLEELDQIIRIALTSNRQQTAGMERQAQEWRPAGERGGVA